MAAIEGDPARTTTRDAADLRLSTRLCLSFGVGTVGVSIVLNTVTVYFPTLMSTVLGVAPAVAGLLLMVSKIYDAFADIGIGIASDRTRSRWGRRRPYLLFGALTAVASLLMIFLVPALHGPALIAYMAAALVIYSTGYSLFNVPYLAMPAEMTDSMNERLRLVSFRTAFVGIGQVFSLAVTAWLIKQGGGGSAGYRLMGGVMAIIAVVSMLLAFFGTADARALERTSGGHRLSWKDVQSLAENRPMLMLMGAKLTQYTAFGVLQPANLMFLLNVLKMGYGGMFWYSIAQNLAVFGSMPLWVRLARRFGKRNCYLAALLIIIPVSISWYWARPGLEGAAAMWAIVWRAVVFGIGSGASLLMSTSMLADATEYDRLKTGHRREGVYSSIYSLNEKLGFAIGAAILGATLSAGHYMPTTGGHLVQQPASAIAALYAVKASAPSAILAIGLILIWFYDLDQRKLDAARAARIST